MNVVARSKRETGWQQYCRFREIFSTTFEWRKLGWKPVPRLDGTGLSSWDTIEHTYCDGERIFKGVNDSPCVITNQELIESQNVKNLPSRSVGALKCWVENRQKTVGGKILTCSDDMFKTSKGWSMDMSTLIGMEVPTYLDVEEKNAIVTWGDGSQKAILKLPGTSR